LGISLENQKFYKGQGCDACGHKGYTGRIGIYEVMEITEKIKGMVTNKETSVEILKIAVSEGMVTMLQDGLDKVSTGLTTIEEVIRVVREN
jgi:type II secretory ATPase GspE/PulE/Tfp pilus assembly ATPase PilB-like protein